MFRRVLFRSACDGLSSLRLPGHSGSGTFTFHAPILNPNSWQRVCHGSTKILWDNRLASSEAVFLWRAKAANSVNTAKAANSDTPSWQVPQLCNAEGKVPPAARSIILWFDVLKK